MQPMYLIRNAKIYAPNFLGTQDIFVAGGKILAMAENLNVSLPGVEVIDATGYTVVPGLIDQHIHVTGGGGEGGCKSRTPELVLSELIETGVTSFVGVSGTDSETRSLENLLAKVRALTEEGASGWMWTSNYAYPETTITGSVRKELLTIPECIGVKIAMGDHRCSFPTTQEILRLLSNIRVGGMISGKTGFLHVHLGDLPISFTQFDDCVAAGMPIKHIRPTHVARHPSVFKAAMAFAKKGGMIDITTGGGCYMGSATEAVMMALDNDVALENITLSSDGHGSMPRFNEAGQMVGLGVGKITGDLDTVRELVDIIGLERALMPMTTNIANALGLTGKGEIKVGNDADIVFMDDAFVPSYVFMKGQLMMRAKEVIVKGTFEE